ncbi:TnsA-like heteromeric transposase endonuclease subunit [Streptomyces sp. NPDC056664]|nr:TnsA-like heteromeric transposase endonuclease subunit [Streptomyces sp. CB02980]
MACILRRIHPIRRAWSSTTGRLVPYGSAAMRLHVMLLDRDSRISGLAALPLELRWRDPSGVRAHVPQLMLRFGDGQAVLADCTSSPELSRRQRSLASAVGHMCTAVGWRYWVLGPVDPVYRRNVTWLAGYRHTRHSGGQALAAAVHEAFTEPAPLWEGVRRVGDPRLAGGDERGRDEHVAVTSPNGQMPSCKPTSARLQTHASANGTHHPCAPARPRPDPDTATLHTPPPTNDH